MVMLPNECFSKIFNNLRNDFRKDYKNLFSCLLVNRQWCRIIVPILWCDPTKYFSNDPRLIKIYLLTLNAEEQARLIPFKIIFPNYPRPLFEYSTFTTHVDDLYNGIRYWLYEGREKENYCTHYDESANAVYDSLVAMFLRTSKKPQHLTFNGTFDKIIFESLCINTTINCLNFRSGYLDSKVIQRLDDIFIKNITLTSLNLSYNRLGSGVVKALAEILCANATLTSLDISNNYINSEGIKAIAEVLIKNVTLTYLNIRGNQICVKGGKVLAEALCKNIALTVLDISNNKIDCEGGKAIAKALCINTTLKILNLSSNLIGYEGGIALAEALCKNTSLIFLCIGGKSNNIGTEGGKALAKALCTNVTLLDISFIDLDFEAGKALIEAFRKNTTLPFLSFSGDCEISALKEDFHTNTILKYLIFDKDLTLEDRESVTSNILTKVDKFVTMVTVTASSKTNQILRPDRSGYCTYSTSMMRKVSNGYNSGQLFPGF